METKKPIHKLRDGRLSASVWANATQKGDAFYGVTFARVFKKGDKLQSSTSFGRSDLLGLAKLAMEAHSWITAQSQKTTN